MADIDQLEIEISAESSDAAQKVDALASALQRLKSALQGGGLDSVPKRIQEIGEKARAAMPEKTQKRQKALQRATAGVGARSSLSDTAKQGRDFVSITSSVSKLERELQRTESQAERASQKMLSLLEQQDQLKEFKGVGSPLQVKENAAQISALESQINKLASSIDKYDSKARMLKKNISTLNDSLQASGTSKGISQTDTYVQKLDVLQNAANQVGQIKMDGPKLDKSVTEDIKNATKEIEGLGDAAEKIGDTSINVPPSISGSSLSADNQNKLLDMVPQIFSGTKFSAQAGNITNLAKELNQVSVSADAASMATAEVGTAATGAGAAGASAMAGLAGAAGVVVAAVELIKEAFEMNKEFLQSDRSVWTDTSWENISEGATNVAAAFSLIHPEILAATYALRSFIQPGQELLGVLGNLAQNGFQKAGDALKNFASSGFQKAGDAVKSFAGNIGNGLKSVGTTIGQKLVSPFRNAISTINKWKESLGRMAFYKAINTAVNTVTQGIRTGIDNLYQFSSLAGGRFASSMNSLASSSMYLKNSLGAMAAPLINAVAPAIDFIISKLVTLINLIGMVFAVLTGAGSFTKATKAAVGYGDALGGAGGAAKELQDYLLGIDELNVIKPSGGGGGGGGGGGLGFGDMFEEVPLPDWAQAMKDAIDKGEWYKAGEILADHLNGIVDSWDSYEWGRKLGEKINHGLDFALGFLRKFDWENLGAKLADAINGLADGIEWDTLGKVIGAGWNAVFGTAYGFFSKLEWGKFGKDIADAFNGWLGEVNWALMGKTISKGFEGLFTMADEAIRRINWPKLGSSIAEMLNNIEWEKVVGLAFKTIQDAIKGAASSLASFVRDFKWHEIATEIANGINNSLHNMTESEWQEIGKTIGNLFTKAFGFVREIIAKIDWPELGRDVAAFLKGIPWREMLGELGGAIAEGLNAAIDTLWEIVSDKKFWAKLGDGIENGLKEFLSNIHIGNAVEGLAKAITEGINLAIRAVSALVSNDTFWADLQRGIVGGINYFFNNVSPEEMASAITGFLKRVLETASKAIGAIAENASWWEDFGTSIGQGINEMISSKDFDSLLTDLATIAQAVLNGVSNALSAVDWDTAWAKIKAAFDEIDWDSLLDSALEFFKTTFFAKMDMKLFEGSLLLDIGKKIAQGIGEAMMEGLESIPILGWAVVIGESLVTIFSDVAQIIGAALTGRWGEIPGLVKNLTDDVHGIVDKWGKKINGTTDTHMDETEKSINRHMGAGREDVLKHSNGMQEDLYHNLQLMKSDTDTQMGLIASGIAVGFETAKENAVPIVETMGTGITAGFEAMRLAVKTKTGDIASTSKTNWNQTKSDTVSSLESMSSSTSTQYSSMSSSVSSNLSQAESTSSAKWAAMEAMSKAKMLAMHTQTVLQYTAIKQAVTSSLNQTQKAAEEIMNRIKEQFNNSTKAAVDTVRKNFGQTTAAVLDGLKAAMNAANAVDWSSIGRNIVNGVSYGVRQQASQLANTVRNTILQAAQAARAAAQIHSPSRLFENEVGVYMGKGIAAGVDKSQGAVMASMYTMTDKLQSAFASAMIASEDAFKFPVHEDFSATYTTEFESNGQEGDTAAEVERGMRNANGEVVATLYTIAGQLIEAVNAVAQRPVVTEIDGKVLMQTVESQQRQRGVDIMGGGVLA